MRLRRAQGPSSAAALPSISSYPLQVFSFLKHHYDRHFAPPLGACIGRIFRLSANSFGHSHPAAMFGAFAGVFDIMQANSSASISAAPRISPVASIKAGIISGPVVWIPALLVAIVHAATAGRYDAQ